MLTNYFPSVPSNTSNKIKTKLKTKKYGQRKRNSFKLRVKITFKIIIVNLVVLLLQIPEKSSSKVDFGEGVDWKTKCSSQEKFVYYLIYIFLCHLHL